MTLYLTSGLIQRNWPDVVTQIFALESAVVKTRSLKIIWLEWRLPKQPNQLTNCAEFLCLACVT